MQREKRELTGKRKDFKAFLDSKANKYTPKKTNVKEDVIKSDNKENTPKVKSDNKENTPKVKSDNKEIKSDINLNLSDTLTIDWFTALEDIKNCLIHSLGLKNESDRVQWFKDFTGYEGKLKNAPTELFEKVYSHLREHITDTKIYLLTKPLIESRKNLIVQSDKISDTKSDKDKLNNNEDFELSSGDVKIEPQSSELDDNYELIENDEDLEKWIALLSNEKVLGVDTETTGLDPHIHKLRLIQIASVNNPTIIIDCFKCNPRVLQPLLLNASVKIFQNAKFDIQFLMSVGLEINQKLFDTQLAHQLVTAGKNNIKSSLKAIASEYLGIELSKEERLTDWSKELSEAQLRYSAIDAKILLPLREKLKEAIVTANLTRVAKIEFDCVLAVAQMEFNGMLLDVNQWQGIVNEAQIRKDILAKEIQDLLPSENTLFKLDINLDSPKQLKEALNRYGVAVTDTNSNTLKKLLLQYPKIIKPLLEYKKCSKLISSFGNSLLKKINPITGRLHGSYWQLGSQAGRFTSSEPNLQQIPRNKEARSCFVASPNHKLIIADYSQIELRIASEVANDKTMIEAYLRGEDLHKLTASIVLNKPLSEITKEDRQLAKACNFGLIYGQSVIGFRSYSESNYGISLSESEAKTIMDNFFKSYSGLANWHKKTKSRIYNQDVNETRTLSDRIRYFDNATPQQILNTPIQGTGADMLKLALGKLVSALKPYEDKVKLLATVHDEIILEAHEDIAEDVAKTLSEVMVNSGKEFLKRVPIEADSSIGNNWADK